MKQCCRDVADKVCVFRLAMLCNLAQRQVAVRMAQIEGMVAVDGGEAGMVVEVVSDIDHTKNAERLLDCLHS